MQNSNFKKNQIFKGEIQCKIENFVSLPVREFKSNYKNITKISYNKKKRIKI